ncbi:ABC transporter substrate-binding protein [Bordetella tumbae]|uniref:tripartite tricarboxylate transporter substrate binding protein n=1 Tax=Bordetella tumbae TaxID=1649139 RepID=UPI0039F0D593
MKLPSALVSAIAAAVALAIAPQVVSAQQANYPSKPITMIVPFGPGGTSDIMARILAKHLSATLPATIVVENKAGAGGAIGMTQLKRSAADGYTVGLSVIGPEVLQPAIRKTGYTYQDFDHVCATYSVPLMMMVTEDSPFRSVSDVIAYAKENPGKLTYGSSGHGTLLHLAMEMLMDQAGATALHVPYKSSGEMVTDLMGKQIMVFNETPTVSKRYKLRPLAVFSDTRLAGYPDVPTIKEAGWSINASIWGGLIAPKGLPKEAIGALENACQTALKSDAYRADVEPLDTPAYYMDSQAFAAFAQDQFNMYGDLINRLGLVEKQ